MLKTFKFLLFSLFLSIMTVACKSVPYDPKYQVLADSLNNLCPLEITKEEISLTQVSYSKGNFFIELTLHDDAPTSLAVLSSLHEEYSKRIDEIGDDVEMIGIMPFIMGLMEQSSTIKDFVNAIEPFVDTPESTQGYMPIKFILKDNTQMQDTITYNNLWEEVEMNEWLNAIMPVEMCKWTMTGDNVLPPLNEVVRIGGIPHVSKDGFLKIYCLYDADPFYSHSGKPMRISDIRGKYFSKKILEDYLSDRMAESNNIRRFLNACERRGISIQFIVDGFKDNIDYDLSTPEFIKRWESWGGKDSIVVTVDALQLHNNKGI